MSSCGSCEIGGLLGFSGVSRELQISVHSEFWVLGLLCFGIPYLSIQAFRLQECLAFGVQELKLSGHAACGISDFGVVLSFKTAM